MIIKSPESKLYFESGADLGEGADASPLRDSAPTDPKGPPLYYYDIPIFGDGP